MAEVFAHAAVLSDRRSAQGQIESLALSNDQLVGVTARGDTELTAPIVDAWSLDWNEVPRNLVPRQGNGAVVIRDERERLFLLPIDDWWIRPSPPSLLATALASSGLDTLIDRFGGPGEAKPAADRATVIVPLPHRAVAPSERLAVAAFLGGAGLVLLSFLAALVIAPVIHATSLVLWGLPQAAASVFALVAAGLLLVSRSRRVHAPRSGIRPNGVHWFAEHASVGSDGAGRIVVTDGQGLWHRLDTPRSSASLRAVSRAVFRDVPQRSMLLLDGTGTVRLQLREDLWYPDGDEALIAFLHTRGIVTTSDDDPRSAPNVALDERSNIDLPAQSLVSHNDLRTARLTPLAGLTFVALLGSAFAAAAGLRAAAVLCGACAALIVGAACWTAWTETSRRVGDPSRPAGRAHFRIRPRSAIITLVVLASTSWAVVAAGMTRWNDLVAAVLIAVGVPVIAWATYRRRALAGGQGAHALLPWLATGAPRDGAS